MSTATLRTERSPNPLERRMISVASGKGGVGKTWFAISLCHALASEGRKVLLFDGDLGLANVDIQLGLTPDRDVGDVIAGNIPLNDAVMRFEEENAQRIGFDVLAGKSGSGALGSLARERLHGLRAELIETAERYDHVVLDLAAGIDASVLTLSSHGGTNYVLLTPDPTSLTDAYAFIKLRRMRDPGADIRVIVNLASDKREGEMTFDALGKACNAFLKFTPRLAGIIRADDKVRDAIRHQVPLLSRHPQSTASANIIDISRVLLADQRRRG